MTNKMLPPDHPSVISAGLRIGQLKAQLDAKSDWRSRAEFRLDSPEAELLRLLSEEEITLNKAREWLREWIIDGVRGPLPEFAPLIAEATKEKTP